MREREGVPGGVVFQKMQNRKAPSSGDTASSASSGMVSEEGAAVRGAGACSRPWRRPMSPPVKSKTSSLLWKADEAVGG